MCSLCNGQKVVRVKNSSMVAFHACPNCKIEKQDLTDIIEQLDATIQKWQREKSA
ncbi:hypothetical protein LG49_2451 [Bacillus licheniformis]|uniref:hypothetical protein n=1 Tax=Bacillus TaxID=1386 RepID=UPI0005DF7032|nr:MULTISPECIES: hypothetical protein [Bacillus]KJE29403.1 hypothetical protein LG49_2451 [Bacillus licheniformis]MED4546953.1 hypothetical protein [Bacillus licheniformis]